REVGEPHLGERVGRARPPRAAERAERPEAPVRPHEHDLEGREREDRVERLFLRHVPEGTRAAVGAPRDLAGEDRDEAEEPAEERRLAGAVWAEQRGELAPTDRERDPLEDGPPVVAEAHVAERDERRHRSASATRRTSSSIMAT